MLSRCVATDTHTFATTYWGRTPLLSSADALPRDFGDLLSPDAVDELIAERGVRSPFIRLAKEGDLLAKDCYLGPAGFGAEMPDQVDSAKVLGEFASGATIVLQGLHRLWPPVIDFVRQAVDELGHPVQANAYVTPPGNRGFDFHYDVHDVFVLQASGHKRWVVHEPVHAHPLPSQPWTQHRAAIAERVTGEPVIDAVLAPGDALYLPRGWVHAAQAQDTTSIHLTVGVAAVTGLDVARAVIEQLADDEAFRRSLPMGGTPTDRDGIIPAVTKVMAQMVDRLRDDATALSTAAATHLTHRHAERTRPVAVRPLATLDAAARADTTSVRWRHALAAAVENADGRVVLRLPDRVMTFPMSCAPALAALHRGRVVTAAGTPGLDRADATVLIRRLLREGVVVPAAADR
ncbi:MULTISPECIES: cupin domain-containing protein [Mycobacteriaceae]|uniref:Cupin domain-containing protein n=1 Tax=Mycolicibacterium parafortuitum TaxID=39692 RepID=A0ACC6MBL7_MYCPF|nr:MULTISPECIES: cupin domain-containing protein [Mycobacteriaceae]MDZ5084338.1 cupin domain-containing protein [Mycolicibacterium parafortuitum]GFM17786.1 cupin 4 family protein [Mycobacterium sp. PO1]GFM24253.1 cupin 4 family protein [Mycobacterium sp. PO2]